MTVKYFFEKIIIVFVLISTCKTYSQERKIELKLNALTTLFLAPGIGVEYQVSANSSVEFNFLSSFWESISGDPYKRTQFTLGYRMYSKKDNSLRGFFYGPKIGAGKYVVNNRLSYPEGYYQKGVNYDIGAFIGYKWNFNSYYPISIEIFATGGWSHSNFRIYEGSTDMPIEDYNGTYETRGKWKPQGVGVMLIYYFNRNKYENVRENVFR